MRWIACVDLTAVNTSYHGPCRRKFITMSCVLWLVRAVHKLRFALFVVIRIALPIAVTSNNTACLKTDLPIRPPTRRGNHRQKPVYAMITTKVHVPAAIASLITHVVPQSVVNRTRGAKTIDNQRYKYPDIPTARYLCLLHV